ncbi:MAG: hypothetical protein MRY49_03600 [Candidatus Pacebacteria bacterium]|nr:hypothetical protein [Candidatus Paceibacterota bacterium]
MKTQTLDVTDSILKRVSASVKNMRLTNEEKALLKRKETSVGSLASNAAVQAIRQILEENRASTEAWKYPSTYAPKPIDQQIIWLGSLMNIPSSEVRRALDNARKIGNRLPGSSESLGAIINPFLCGSPIDTFTRLESTRIADTVVHCNGILSESLRKNWKTRDDAIRILHAQQQSSILVIGFQFGELHAGLSSGNVCEICNQEVVEGAEFPLGLVEGMSLLANHPERLMASVDSLSIECPGDLFRLDNDYVNNQCPVFMKSGNFIGINVANVNTPSVRSGAITGFLPPSV